MSLIGSDGRWAERASIALTATAVGFLTAWWLIKASKAGGRTVTTAQRTDSARQQELCLGDEPRGDPYDPEPRSNYLSWDDYFLYVAFLSAQRSKDPNKQVGACIVSKEKIIVGIGYNGFPRGCSDAKLPWAKRSRTNNLLDTKYPYVCHAEMNAVLNTNTATLAGCSLYVTMFPCNECAKLIIQAGISEVVYFEARAYCSPVILGKDKRFVPKPSSPAKGGIRPEEAYAASKRLLAMAGVRLRQHSLALPLLLPLPGRHKPHSSS